MSEIAMRAQELRVQSIYVLLAVLAAKIGVLVSGLDRLTTISWSRLTIAAACIVAILAVALWIAGLRGARDPRTDRMPFTALWHSSRFAWMAACVLWAAGLGSIALYAAASTLSVLSQYVSAKTTTVEGVVTHIDRNSTRRGPCEVKATLGLKDGREIGACLVARWTQTPASYSALQERSPVLVVLRHTTFGTAVDAIELDAESVGR